MNTSVRRFIKKYKWVFGLSLSLLIGQACTEPIDMKPAHFEKHLVVDATITNEFGFQLVRLGRTMDFGEKKMPPVTDASVEVQVDDSVIRFYERDTTPGFYYSEIQFAGEPGKTYQLMLSDIDVTGSGVMSNYSAAATMPDTLHIDSVTTDYYKNWKALALKCWAWDPPVTNYYNFKAWRNGVLLSDTLYEYSPTDDILFNGNYTNGIPCQFLRDEKTDEHAVNGDTLTLEIDNIDKAYFNYINSAISEYYGYNPMFGGLPANVYSNISNEALGVFRVYTINKRSVIVKNLERD